MEDTMWVKELIYPARPINEKYYEITYQDEETKKNDTKYGTKYTIKVNILIVVGLVIITYQHTNITVSIMN